MARYVQKIDRLKIVNPVNQGFFRGLFLCMVVVLCAQLSSCNGVTTVWSAESKSPSGQFIAEAHTVTIGGFGTAAPPVTSVYLRFARHSPWPPFLILAFANPTADPIGVTAVKMVWITKSHLDVTYKKPAFLTFQAIKAAGVQITVHQAGE